MNNSKAKPDFDKSKTESTSRQLHPVQIWLTVIVCILVILCLETRKGIRSNYNLFLNGDSSISGADVKIDDTQCGAMDNSGDTNFGGAIFYWHLDNGQHTIEVKKHGYQPFTKQIEMHGEEYIYVDLKRNA